MSQPDAPLSSSNGKCRSHSEPQVIAMMKRTLLCLLCVSAVAGTAPAFAQAPDGPGPGGSANASSRDAVARRPQSVPTDYVVGADDVLSVIFWRDKDMSADVVVRPDGRITLPLLNEVEAAGLTPEQLRDRIEGAARRYVSDATVASRSGKSKAAKSSSRAQSSGPVHMR